MKNKVISVYITASISILLLACIFVFYFCTPFSAQSLLLNICYSVFGGSVITFILSLFEYFNLKRTTVNDFYNECFEFLKMIHNISFMDISVVEKTIAKYKCLKTIFDNDIIEKDNFVSKAANDLREVGIMVNSSDIIPFLKSETESFEKNVYKTASSFIDVSKYNTNKLWKIADDIFYLNPFFNKKHKENLKLCEDVEETKTFIIEKAYHLKLFVDKEMNNYYQVVRYIEELNNKIFKIERSNNVVKAWEERFNYLSDKLNKYMSDVFKIEYKKQEAQPFYVMSYFEVGGQNKTGF